MIKVFFSKIHLSSLGLSMILVAIPIGMYAKIFWGFMSLNIVFYSIGSSLLLPYKKLFRTSFSEKMLSCMLFSILALLYIFLGGYEEKIHIVYNLIVVLTCFSLGYSSYAEDINIELSIIYLWLFSALCSVCAFVTFNIGLFNHAIEYEDFTERYETEVLIFDLLTVASSCISNLVASLYIIQKNMGKSRFLLIAAVIFICLDIYIVFITQKRTPIIVLVFVLLFFSYKNRWFNFRLFGRNIFVFFLIVVVGYNITNVYVDPYEFWPSLYNSIINGLRDMLFGTNSLDITNSASIRYYARQQAWNMIYDFSIQEFFLGKGYMTMWIDAPLLQSFLDMGVVGFLLYFYYSIITPFNILRKKEVVYPELMWAVLSTSYGMIACFNSGYPYGHTKWLPICVLVFVYNGINRYEYYSLVEQY